MNPFLAEVIRKALDAAHGDPDEAYKVVRSKLDEATTDVLDLWDEIRCLKPMSKKPDDDETFLRDTIARAAERWRRRRDRPLKPPPRMR